jgi:hypothetical protein
MTARLAILGAGLALAHGGAAVAQVAGDGGTCERPPTEVQTAVTGQVTDTETGLPLQEARILVDYGEPGARRQRLELTTDLQGGYAACELPAGVRVVVQADFGSASDRRSVNTTPGLTQTADFRLDAPRSVMRGRVVEAGTSRPVSEADLRVEGSSVRGMTRPDGTFQLPPVPPGNYSLVTSHIAYGTRTDSVAIHYGAIMQYNIVMAAEAIALEPINVDVRIISLDQAGFYDRRDTGFGTYIMRSSWEGRGSILPSDIMRTVPGVRVMPARGFGNVVLDRGNCRFRYFMDGARVGETFEFDEIPENWIEAIEVYRGVSQIPAQFRSSPSSARANCGVIVIWTRRAR